LRQKKCPGTPKTQKTIEQKKKEETPKELDVSHKSTALQRKRKKKKKKKKKRLVEHELFVVWELGSGHRTDALITNGAGV